VLLAVNMQTSFMHPPFGFALFYLRSVAPMNDYDDKITRKRVAKVTTGQIYWGAVPFVIIQIIMVGLIIAFPKLVSSGLGKEPTVDVDKAFQQMQTAPRQSTGGDPAPAPGSGASGAQPAAPDSQGKSDDDAMKSLLEGFKRDADKKP
jgi:GntP family gluconate:H+ symporter